MAKQAVKEKGKAVQVENTTEMTPIEKAALEYAEAQMECEELESLPVFKVRDEAKKKLLAMIDAENEAEAKVDVKVDDYKLSFTAKRASSEINDISKVKSLLGEDLFLKVATVPLKDLKVYLSKFQYDSVITTEHTGARTIKVKKL